MAPDADDIRPITSVNLTLFGTPNVIYVYDVLLSASSSFLACLSFLEHFYRKGTIYGNLNVNNMYTMEYLNFASDVLVERM